MLLHIEVSQVIVENLIRRFYRQVEAQVLQQHILVVYYRVPPSPEVFGLLIYKEVRVLLCDATAGDNNLFDLPAMFFDFGGQE